MNEIEKLREEVRLLYEAAHPGRSDWADWIYEGHVLLVAQSARKIAERYGANPDLAEASALLHDVADAVMKRADPRHEEETFSIARSLLEKSGFSEADIRTVVDDAARKHSCHGATRPDTLEGKCMAAADGVVHLTSDFYVFAEKRKGETESVQGISAWALPKIERDFHNKIAFSELQESVRPDYERLKDHFTRLRENA